MTGDSLRRLIDGMRQQEADAIEEKKQFHTWTEADTRAMFSNPESERLIRGDHSILTPAERAEVDRLSAMVPDDPSQNQKSSAP